MAMKTWVIGAAAVAAIFAGIAFGFFMQSKNLADKVASLQERIDDKPLVAGAAAAAFEDGIRDVNCTDPNKECLYQISDAYYPMGYAIVDGYFTRETRGDFEGADITCDMFVVTSGPEKLLSGFRALIDSGSSIFMRKGNGIAVGIDLADIEAADRDTIKASTEVDKATLNVFIKQPADKGADPCFSPFVVIDAK